VRARRSRDKGLRIAISSVWVKLVHMFSIAAGITFWK